MIDPRPAAAPPSPSLWRFALANAGGVIAYLPLLSLLLPIKVEAIGAGGRIQLLSMVAITGAVSASLSNILFGWLSDLAHRRGRGRRVWMAGGIAATALSYLGIAAAQTPATLTAAVVLFQIAVNALLAPLMAIMAEEIPDAHKGFAGGMLALGGPAASGFTALLVAEAGLGEGGRLALLAAAVAACTLPLLLARPRGLSEPPAPATARARPPRRDLFVAGASRLLVQVAAVVTQAYLLYYFETIVPADARAGLPRWIGGLFAVAFVLPLPAALVLGRLADRVRRRKPILLAAALVAAAGLVGMAVARGRGAGAIGFAVYTTGSAVFVAIQAGLAMQLLPDPRHRGRDLGFFNLTNTLPSLLGPGLAWAFATPHDFTAVMLALAALTLVGGCGMLGVRAWR